jgi:polyhydroxyalkanoate synthesis repressor PhaR
MRLIKKYPNRRLYDTDESRYITLEDVKQLVVDHQDFWVQDTKSKNDITRTILLQIILEQESAEGEPIFSTPMLKQFVCFYGDDMHKVMSEYMERSLKLFVDGQDAIRRQMSTVVPSQPIDLMQDLTRRNLAIWNEIQSTMVNFPSPMGGRDNDKDND